MSQKRIGLVISRNSETNGLNVSGAYATFISNFGIVIPINALDPVVHDIDLLILPGGSDVNPARYGETELNYMTGNPNLQLEYFDTVMLPQYIDRDIPIFGICRGFQTLAVHYGCRLDQHIAQAYSAKRDDLAHDIKLIDQRNQLPFSVPKTLKVNSLHHQGLYMQDVVDPIVPLYLNATSCNVEVFKVRTKNIYGVQYHPEEIWDRLSMAIIQNILNNGNN